MKKSNILYIFGDNSFLIEREKIGLIKIFQEKYGTESVEICSLDNPEKFKHYHDMILSVSLFGEKRLFVFFGGRDKKSKRGQNKENQGFENFLDSIVKYLSDTDFLLFYNLGNGEENLKKWLEKYASPREQKFSFSPNNWEKYTNLSLPILKKTLTQYEKSEKMRDKGDSNKFLGHAIMQTLYNLETLESQNIPITESIIEDFSHTYEGAKMFDLVDCILAENILEAKKILDKIQKNIDYNTIDMFLAGFISTLKNNLYILRLRDMNMSASKIAQHFPKIHSFVLNKAYKSKISADNLGKFYQKIILANIAYKSGKGMKKTILGRFFEIDTALLELKK